MARGARIFPGERHAMRHAARKPEYRPKSKAVADSKQYAIGDCACERPQGPMLSSQQIVSEIHRSQDVKRAAGDADQSERMPVNGHRERHRASVTDWPLSSIRKESPARHALSFCFGVSMPSSVSWNVPWWIAMLVLAPRISWARTASSGAMWTADMNQRGSYAPIGRSASRGAPNSSRIRAK